MYRSRVEWSGGLRTVVTRHATVDGVSQWTVLLTRYIYRLQFPRQPLFPLRSALFFPSRVARRNGRDAARSAQWMSDSFFTPSPEDGSGRPDRKNPSDYSRFRSGTRLSSSVVRMSQRRNIAPPPLFPPVSPITP